MLCRQIGFVCHGIRDAHRIESVSAVNALRFLMLLQIPFRPYPANGQWKDLQSNTPLIEMAVVGPMRRGEGRSRAIGSRSHPSVGIPRPRENSAVGTPDGPRPTPDTGSGSLWT